MSSTTKPARIFFPDNRFPEFARRPGGIDRRQAITNAESEIDDIREECGVWIDARIAQLIELAAGLHPHPDDATIEKAYEISSELRDIGSTVGCDLVSVVARAFCEVLVAIRGGSPAEKDVIDCYADALTLSRLPNYRNLRSDQVPDLVSGLLRVVERVSLVPAADAT